MDSKTQLAVISLTTLSTITSAWMFTTRNSIERANAVILTLISITILLAIETFYHFTKPRPPEYSIMGGKITEIIFITVLVLYEWIPTLYRLPQYEGTEKFMRREKRLLKFFAFVGVITASITFIGGGFLYAFLWEEAAKAIDAYGMLFIVPTLGVGEFFLMRYGPAQGFVSALVMCGPIMAMVFMYLDRLTFFTYLTTAIAFFSDQLLGCRYFLKNRYLVEQERRANQENQVEQQEEVTGGDIEMQ